MSVSKSGCAANQIATATTECLQEKRCSVLVNKIIEDLNDNGCPQSEGITSVCLANEAWAALLR